eukprot:CAMPEP_0201577066 /NCGR_PEP_ID=MMETSP0190_2-20130828/23247_1 /ASSEMBLY_ACC=CAM_ASM_000263 /TAXON_ID=37353 /ORGANISM="Rosalina sp." /LENGTH=349 /DNA_ID=CAMNT_0048008675 /DNA_START=132 /DNA_END=1181 /DNA_ORIENTATION=+
MGTEKTSTAIRLGLEVVHPNWLHNSTTHYMKSNPGIYRPQAWDEKVHGEQLKKNKNKLGDDDNHNSYQRESTEILTDIDSSFLSETPTMIQNGNGTKLKSILIGNKRKRDGDDDDGITGPNKKKAKSVKFKGIDDEQHSNDENDDIDPEIKLQNSLTGLISNFNENKDLLLGKDTKAKDIVITEVIDESKEDEEDDDEDEDVDLEQTDTEQNDKDDGNDEDEDDDFDFDAIHQDIDKAMHAHNSNNTNLHNINHNKIKKNDDKKEIVIKTSIVSNGDRDREDWDDGPIGSEFYPSSSPPSSSSKNGNKHHKQDNDEHLISDNIVIDAQDDEDEDSIMDELDSELESLSS